MSDWAQATPASSNVPNNQNRTPKDRIESLATAATNEDVDQERCVVEQYRTTVEQKEDLIDLLASCPRDRIPLEWVIDIADETNGWFYGTAYHYDDTTNMLHVMVPDKQNPTFDGPVYLDHRTVHLVECVDGRTEALFNKIIRENIIRVKWEVDWFDEDTTPNGTPVKSNGPTQQNGRWIASAARYYLRIANQLLVEDEDFGEGDSRGFVMLTADMNVRLKLCHKGKGQEDFDRLVTDGCVLSTPEVLEAAKKSLKEMMEERGDRRGSVTTPGEKEVSVRKLADMSRTLKECVSEILDEREKAASHRVKMAKSFKSFVMEGDLDAGLRLLADSDEVQAKQLKKMEALAQPSDEPEERDQFELAADDAWIIANKLEKGTIKLLRAGGDGSANSNDEVEFLRKTQKKMKAEMELLEQELQSVRLGKSF